MIRHAFCQQNHCPTSFYVARGSSTLPEKYLSWNFSRSSSAREQSDCSILVKSWRRRFSALMTFTSRLSWNRKNGGDISTARERIDESKRRRNLNIKVHVKSQNVNEMSALCSMPTKQLKHALQGEGRSSLNKKKKKKKKKTGMELAVWKTEKKRLVTAS